MPTYVLRDVPPDLWETFKQRSRQDGWPLRPLLLQLIADYATGRLHLSTVPPQRPNPPIGHLSGDEGWRILYTAQFDAMRREAEGLLASKAKYMDPMLAHGKQGEPALYVRFAEELAQLERHGIVPRHRLPNLTDWRREAVSLDSLGPGDSLDKRTLQRLADDAKRIIDALHADV